MNHDSIIAREGLPFIISFLVFTAASYFLGALWSSGVLFVITLFVIWFFRNPERTTPQDPKLVISPADGKVIRIEEVDCHDLIPGRFTKVSIFMNVFNVHVNRIPYSGKVEKVHYHKGRFLSADLDKASEQNERNSIVIKTTDGLMIMTVQIAGLIARRIVWWIEEGMEVKKGERFGLIRFGSRLEVFMPVGTDILVKLGDKVKAGETPIGGLL